MLTGNHQSQHNPGQSQPSPGRVSSDPAAVRSGLPLQSLSTAWESISNAPAPAEMLLDILDRRGSAKNDAVRHELDGHIALLALRALAPGSKGVDYKAIRQAAGEELSALVSRPEQCHPHAKTLSIVSALVRFASELDDAFHELVENCRNGEPTFYAPAAERRKARGDRCFEIGNACRVIVQLATAAGDTPVAAAIGEAAELLSRRAFRYNRESPGFAYTGPIGLMPIEHTRNFLRDGAERMYFLPLHSLPTAYDFFCCTFVETPQHYRQELHLHIESWELTLVLDGEAKCEWYRKPSNPSDGNELSLAGAVTAGPLTAFLIPPRVVHTISNPTCKNTNITAKLTMFIEDRIGAKDWEFTEQTVTDEPVSLVSGDEERFEWGSRYRYQHHFRNIEFSYRLTAINPHAEYEIALGRSGQAAFFLVFTGTVEIGTGGSQRRTGEKVTVPQGTIVKLSAGHDYTVVNAGDERALLFAVAGLDQNDFLADKEAYQGYPRWLLDELDECRGWE